MWVAVDKLCILHHNFDYFRHFYDLAHIVEELLIFIALESIIRLAKKTIL